MPKKSLKCKLWVKFFSSVCASSDDKWNKVSHAYSAFFFSENAPFPGSSCRHSGVAKFLRSQPITLKDSHGFSTKHTCAIQGFRCANLFNVEGLDHLCLFFVTVETQTVTIPRLKEGRIVCCDPAVKVSHLGLRLIEFQVRKMPT